MSSTYHNHYKIICIFHPELPELCEILPKPVVDSMLSEIEGDSSTAALKQLFASLMTSDKAAIASSLQKLVSRLEHEGDILLY